MWVEALVSGTEDYAVHLAIDRTHHIGQDKHVIADLTRQDLELLLG